VEQLERALPLPIIKIHVTQPDGALHDIATMMINKVFGEMEDEARIVHRLSVEWHDDRFDHDPLTNDQIVTLEDRVQHILSGLRHSTLVRVFLTLRVRL
jgi:hypothetical protein